MSGFFDPPLAARQPLPYARERGIPDDTAARPLQAVGGSEAEPGKLVTSSNHALAWRCVGRAGIAGGRPAGGAPDERP